MGDENQTIPGNGRLPRQYPSEVDQGSTKVTLPDAKTPSPIEKLTQDITPPGSPAPVVPGTLGIAGVWSASTLDTEGLAAIGLARMTDGSYMTVTVLEGGGINMMPYMSSAARVMVPM